MSLCGIPEALQYINAKAVVILLMTHMISHAFLILLKTNVKAFNLMSRTNETRHTEWNKTCNCKWRLDAGVCNNKQRWNEEKCKCERKGLIDKGICDKGFI